MDTFDLGSVADYVDWDKIEHPKVSKDGVSRIISLIDSVGNKYGCNRCMYTWDDGEYCPMCGQPATHEIR